jgi:hypothetical protein
MNCAYCDRERTATREHVWPSCFLDRYGREAAKFSVKSQKVHGADYVVGDVCAECNGGRLSEADAYFCLLYDKYFYHLHDFESKVVFEYDYGLLLRSLLKISFNSARAGGSNTEPFLPCRAFMLGEKGAPLNVASFIELVSPSLWPDKNDASIVHKVFPNTFRAIIARFTKPGGEKLLYRVVAVNSFFFHVHLPLQEMPNGEFERIVADFGATLAGAVRLTATDGSVEVRTSPQDGLGSMLPHLMQHREQYDKYFARRRGK